MLFTDLRPGQEPLDWTTRMKIAADAAAGLEYLHDEAIPAVIYRDIKPSNILLGEGYNAKLSDFGLAKLGPVGDKTHVTTRVMGTHGYCAPEYLSTGKLTIKSDIYSFGVVFLELITGRRALDSNRPPDEQDLVAWVCFYQYQNVTKGHNDHIFTKKNKMRIKDVLFKGQHWNNNGVLEL